MSATTHPRMTADESPTAARDAGRIIHDAKVRLDPPGIALDDFRPEGTAA